MLLLVNLFFVYYFNKIININHLYKKIACTVSGLIGLNSCLKNGGGLLIKFS